MPTIAIKMAPPPIKKGVIWLNKFFSFARTWLFLCWPSSGVLEGAGGKFGSSQRNPLLKYSSSCSLH